MSLFAPANPTLAPVTGSVFGSSAAAEVKPGQAATNAPVVGGMFGTANAVAGPSNTQSVGGLFGTTQPAANPTTTRGNMFGNPQSATTASAPGTLSWPSIGPTGSQQSGMFRSLMGNQSIGSQAQQGQQTAQTAYFESLLVKNKQRQGKDGESSDSKDVPGIQLGLDDISRRARELGRSNHTNGIGGADTRAHYLLAASGVNPVKTLRELDAINAQVGAQPVSNANLDWEPDSHKYVEQLQTQMTMKLINEALDRANKRFDAFLQDHIDMDWADQRRKVYEHFGLTPRTTSQDLKDPKIAGSEKGGFGRSRRGLAGNADSLSKSTASRSVFGKSGMQKSVIGSPAVGQGNIQVFGSEKVQSVPTPQEDRFIREKGSKYAEKVQALNQSRLQESFYPLLWEFLEVENSPGSDAPSELLLAYRTLIEITNEGTDTSFRPRSFKNEYLDENPNSERSTKGRQRILTGSRRILEKQFFDELVTAITRNTKEAQVGGIPSRIHRVKAYVRVRMARKDLAPDGVTLQKIGDDYCWALLFYFLRCGFTDEATQYVLDNRSAFNAIDRMFATYITQYSGSGERRLSPQYQAKLNSEYMSRIRLAPDNQTDPYRLACYKVIGRCDLTKKSFETIPTDVRDWMWLQFCLTREANRVDELATDVYNLSDLQADIREIGNKHFKSGSDAGVGYGTFFLLQVLGGLFEDAVDFLYGNNYVAAVHFAIALDFHGLLRVSSFNVSDSDLLSHTTRGLPQLDFGRMIGYYTRDFRTSNVLAAVDYLVLIHLNADLEGELGRSYSGLCHEALRELVLETREFATLLGDINASNGQRIKGVIELRLPLIGLTDKEDYLRTVTVQAARVADETGRTTDSVLLYHLAEDYNNVIDILNRALSDTIALSEEDILGTTQSRLEPLKPRDRSQNQNQGGQSQSSLSLVSVDDPFVLAQHFINLYNPNALYFDRIARGNRDVCGLLMQIQTARQSMLHNNWSEALSVSFSSSPPSNPKKIHPPKIQTPNKNNNIIS